MAGSRPPLSEHSRMALRNPESTELEEMADEDSDDPIDMLSSKSKTSSRRKAGPSRDPSQSLLNPTIDLPPKCEVKSGSPSSPDLDLLFTRFGQLHLSKPKPKFRRRKWPESLTPAQQIVVDEGLRADNSIVYDLPGASCGRKELQKLSSPTHWLNDEIINFYGSLINLNSSDPKTSGDEALNVHCFSSFFMIQFDLGGHPKVSRWTRKINIFEKDLIFFPINLSNLHWVLGVINNRQKRFEYYDSLGGSGSGVLSKLRRYYQDEYQAKKDEDVDLNEWSDYQPEVPLQSNSSDCGVFVCQFMYSLSQDLIDQNLQEGKVVKLFDFTAENMPYLRLKMAFEIIRKSFLSDQSYYH
ncbi:hypothetical protein PSTG_03205 [Puccinia striiformis f. sp. tritici PST-78]|uniref:Ubiquitin-like protease family profile domain-containing protein n=1 Tax=Puccinia striiformis f. sp. tritici PST-78 TaxID=1165861 RepID=A0A0L0VWJ0_9BASI|nr:hypothetical protein PSTG_03205 [Puccinia striiformis f. sp. tritici PST-78]